MSQNSMILVQSTWQESQTFRMIPVTLECPYVECILDPATKVFVVITKINKTSLHMIPRLDDNGDPIYVKGARPNGRTVREERKTIDTFQEFYIEDKKFYPTSKLLKISPLQMEGHPLGCVILWEIGTIIFLYPSQNSVIFLVHI